MILRLGATGSAGGTGPIMGLRRSMPAGALVCRERDEEECSRSHVVGCGG